MAHGEEHHYEDKVHPQWADHCTEFKPEDDSKHGRDFGFNSTELAENIIVLTEEETANHDL